MDKVKFGIIGVGNMGSVHLGFFQNGQVANGVCTAIADVNPEKLAAARKNSPGAYVCYDSGEELIDKAGVDAVLLAVPHYSHPPLAERAFRRGLHVLCEKPAGVYTKQVKEMNMSADKSGKLFTLMYNQRTNPLYKKMHEIVAEGGIGEIRRVNWLITNWFRTQYYYDSGAWRATWRGEGGGVLMNQCPHQLDLLQWICGMMPEKVHAFGHFGKWHDIETEDDVTAYLTFPNGATGAFITSTADAPGTNRFEILGSKGKLVCEKDVLTYSRSDVDLQDFLKREKDGFRAPEFTVQAFPLEGENPQHVGILNNFANAILGTEPLYVDGREGLRCVELIDAMLLSAWENAEVTLPIDDEYYYKKLSEHIAVSRVKEGKDILIDNSGSYGGTH